MNQKNVQLPITLMNEMIELLECWDTANCAEDFKCIHECVLSSLLQKRESIELRKIYSRMITAKDDDTRDMARIEYLSHKRRLQ